MAPLLELQRVAYDPFEERRVKPLEAKVCVVCAAKLRNNHCR